MANNLEEFQCEVKDMIIEIWNHNTEAINARITALEKTVNEVIIASALEVDHDIRYNETKEKWGSQLEPISTAMAVIEPDHDYYEDFMDLDDEAGNTKLSELNAKLEALKAALPASASPETEEAIKDAIIKVDEEIAKESTTEPDPAEGFLFDDADVKAFKKGGRIK